METENDESFAIHPLVLQIHKLFNKDLALKYEFLAAQLEAVVENNEGKRFTFTDKQRHRLAKLGMAVKESLGDVCMTMRPSTILKWNRDQKRKKWDQSERRTNQVGRPPTGKDTECIVLEIAQNNELWGCRTIAGEMKKLGHPISHTTVYSILKAHGIPLDPGRKSLSWKKFIESHKSLMWACDLFTEEVWTPGGLLTFYVLFFIHIGTRRVYVGGVTPNPNAAWMQQQARNFSMVLAEMPQPCRYLIHDNDSIFLPFDPVIKTDDVKVVKTPKQSPWCNGYAERFVSEARGTLDNLILVGETQLRVAMKKIEEHHNFHRPHQGLGNTVPLDFQYPQEPVDPENVRCHSTLGGLLNSYHADKAA